MYITRRSRLLLLATGLALLTASSGWAQDYPTKVIRYLIGEPAGSNTDTMARIIADGLSDGLGKRVIVDNRGGASGNIAAEIASRAPADGYTVFQIATTHTVNVTLYKKLSYNLVEDFVPVTRLATLPSVVVVHPSLPVRSLKDLVQLAKGKPGALTYCSSGIGTAPFVATELFKQRAQVDILHVPYKGGGQALAGLLSGEVVMSFFPLPTSLPFIRQGKLRALAVTTPDRVPLLPNIPTISESGFPGFQANNWYGLVVPTGTPKEIISTLNKATVSVLNSPSHGKRLKDLGFVTVGDQPDEFGAYIKSQIESLGKAMQKFRGVAN